MPDLFNEPVKIKCKKGLSLPVARVRHNAVLHNGVIYVGGGISNEPFTVDVYHPDTNKWDVIGTPHALFAMSVLMGKVVIVDGQTKKMLFNILGGKTTDKVLTLENGQWKDYAKMSAARSCATAVSHQSVMIVMGGYDGDRMISSTELLDSSTSQWFMIKCNDLKLYSSQSLIVGDTLYVLGRISADGTVSTAVYSASLDTLYSHQLKWNRLVDAPGVGSAAVGLNNKYVIAVGGLNITDDDDDDNNDDDNDDDNNDDDNDDDDDDSDCYEVEGVCNKVFTLNSIATTWNFTATIPLKVMGAAVALDNNYRLVIIGGLSKGEITKKVSVVSFR